MDKEDDIMKKHETTKKHFLIFKEEFLKWVDYWGLRGWELTFRHKPTEDSRAEICLNNLDDRQVTVVLSKSWGENDDLCDYEVRRVAFHECAELRYIRLDIMARNRNMAVLDREVTEEVHNLIRQDENLIFDKE